MNRRRRAGSSSVGRHDHVLLFTHGHSEPADDNSTTAYTFTEATKTIKVTLSIADLPSISYFHVSCPDLQDRPFRQRPEILWSSEDLVLFTVFLAHPTPMEYFIYRAGREPSLDLLPGSGDEAILTTQRAIFFSGEKVDPSQLAVLPDGDGGNFVLAAFYWDWLGASWIFTNRPGFCLENVIVVRGGALGYVDLWKGILLCNMLEEPVTTRFIPLPNPLPGNRKGYNYGMSERASWVRLIRDAACTDGLTITCVEMEDLYRFVSRTPDGDVLHDSDIDPSEEAGERRWVGWRLVTWYREIPWDYWRKGCVLHVDELGTVSLPRHPARTEPFPPNGRKPSSSSGPRKLPLRHMLVFCPILCGKGVVCFLSKRDSYRDHRAWIITVDMRKKAVRGLTPYYDETPMTFNLTYLSCALKKYLKSESDGGGSLVVENTGSHGKRRRSSPEYTSIDSSQPKRTLRDSTMQQRKRYC
ncbi:hypothetical protein VPH35_139207 [Triticum aestivum]